MLESLFTPPYIQSAAVAAGRTGTVLDELLKAPTSFHEYGSFEGIGIPLAKKVLEKGYALDLAPDYFQRTRPQSVVLAEKGETPAGMIVTESFEGIAYLNKYTVVPDFKGNHVGSELWKWFADHHDKWCLRTRQQNSINSFYRKHAGEPFASQGKWNFYCKGLNEVEQQKAIDFMMKKPDDFKY